MGQERVSLHLSKSNTSVLLPTFDRLVGEDVVWASGSCLRLIRHHMAQSLIVHDTKVNVDFHLIPKYARIHRFISIIIVSLFDELVSKVANAIVVFVLLECLSLEELASQSASFRRQTLNEHPNGHPRGKGVRVDQDVWDYALLCEGHINVGP